MFASRRSDNSGARQKLVVMGLMLAIVGLAQLPAVAQEPEQSAHEFIENVKNDLVEVIANKEQLEQEGGQEQYIDEVKSVLEPVVDFDFIARGVMGRYAKQASPEQRERFATVFKQTLVNTYAKGLAGYAHYDISVAPAEDDVSGKRTVGVALNVSNGDQTHRLAFTTKLNRDGEWRVTNMILNGVNLGKSFRGQFESAMQKNDGDIDAAIESWTV